MPDRQPSVDEPSRPVDESPPSFAEQAAEQSPGFFREFADFLRNNKKWWLIPILLVLGVVGLLAMLSTSVVAPFIYPLF